jgi:circadian clock protein KaiC
MGMRFTTEPQIPPVASTGIAGLDSILHGGLPREEMHMAQGVAGTGKTTFALHFLRAGAQAGERCVYLTLSQSKVHLERIAHSHGWTLDGITVHELAPGTVAERVASRQSVLPTIEIELETLFKELTEIVQQTQPRRAVIDSITILQMLAGGVQRYHREVVTLRQLFVERQCTVLALADHPADARAGQAPEVIFHPLCGVVIDLSQQPRAYGDARRQLRVIKARAMPNDGGVHDLKIRRDGMEVYPRLGAYQQAEYDKFEVAASGVRELDEVLGGGLEFGTSCLLVGPSGTGKSTLATLFTVAAAERGECGAVFLFDERPETYKVRARGIGIPLRKHVETGRVTLRQIDPGEIAPGEFAHQVRETVERQSAKVVVVDSVAGYFNAVGSSELFVAQLHELLTYLSRKGVLAIFCASQEGFMSIGQQVGVDISYLSDTILSLGHFEDAGCIRRHLTASKRRQGEHATTIRELTISPAGIQLGEPLRGFQNIVLKNGQPVRNRDENGAQ